MKLTKDKKLWIPDTDNWFWRDSYEQKHFFETMRYIPNRGVALDMELMLVYGLKDYQKTFLKSYVLNHYQFI